MAEGGRNPKQVFNITLRIDNKLLDESVNEGDRTNIIDSNIDTLIAGAAQPGADDSRASLPQRKKRKAPNVPKPPTSKEEDVESDSSTRRRIPLLREQKEDGGRNNEIVDVKISFSRASMLVDKARYLIAKLDHEGVAKLLDDPVITSSDDIAGKTLLAESHLVLGRVAKALKVIEILKKILMISQMNGSDVMAYAKDLAENSAHIRAMILFPIACDMFHANASSPDDAVNRMFECIWKMDDSVAALIKEGDRARIVATDVGIDYMEKMYKNMSSVENANPENKVVKEGRALYRIGYNYVIVGQDETSLKPWYRGVELMEQQFRENESMYQVYGALLHSIGVVYFNLGNFTEAEKYYHKAVKSRESATDYDSESKKRESIDRSRTELNKTRAKLGKK